MPAVLLAWEFLRRNAEFQADWQNVAQGWGLGGLMARAATGQRWGFDPSDPFLDAPWELLVPLLIRQVVKLPLDHLEPNQLALLFDVSLPLAPQLRGALDLLKVYRNAANPRRRRPKLARSNFSLYLRVLDARASGASLDEIAATLSIQDQDPRAKVGELLRQAREWTWPERYLLIASSPPTGSLRPPE